MEIHSESSPHEQEEQHKNGVLHLSNGAIITLIVMVILTFISLLGLLGLYFLCPRRRRIQPPSQQQQHHETQIKTLVGLKEEEINKLPLLTYQELVGIVENVEGCAVCLGEFGQTEKSIRFLPHCNHCFHPSCVDKWLRTSASCPLCRNNLLLDAAGSNSEQHPPVDLSMV